MNIKEDIRNKKKKYRKNENQFICISAAKCFLYYQIKYQINALDTRGVSCLFEQI